MKALLLLLFSGVAVSAAAQLTDGELKKITEKNLHLLQEAQFEKPQPPTVRIVNAPAMIPTLKQDHMPCVVPEVKAMEPMPNALPALTIPDVAAIPNPVLPKDLQAPAIIQTPGSK